MQKNDLRQENRDLKELYEEEDKNEIKCEKSQHNNDDVPRLNNEQRRGAFLDNAAAAEDLVEGEKYGAEGLIEQQRSFGSINRGDNFAEGAKENEDNESMRGSHGGMRQKHKEPAAEDKKVERGEAIIRQEEIL